jgi:homeodomain-containing protein
MKHKYAVRLADTEREQLRHLIASGTAPARKLMHARILLKADESPQGPAETDDAIAQMVDVSQPTVFRVRRHDVEQGLQAALDRRAPTREYVRKLDGAQEARLIALACGPRPQGQARWSLRLLADKLVEWEIGPAAVSSQTVRRILKNTRSSRT